MVNRLQADSHLVQLQQQDGARPAGVIEGQQEDAEQPGRAADQGRDNAPHALLLIMQHTVGRPVWNNKQRMFIHCECKTALDNVIVTVC